MECSCSTILPSGPIPFNWLGAGGEFEPDSVLGLSRNDFIHIQETIQAVRREKLGRKLFVTVKRDKIRFSRDQSTIPLSLVIYRDKAFALLRNVSPLKGGAQQPTLKLAYNPETREKYVRKHINSIGGKLIVTFIATACPPDVKKGFAEIAHFDFSRVKGTYFEKLYPGSITDLYLANRVTKQALSVQLKALFNLQQALHTIHQLSMPPLSLETDDGMVVLNGGKKDRVPCFHGDISPNNIVYELSATDNTCITGLRLIDWNSAAKPEEVWSTCGWNSPEYKKLLQTYHTSQEICDFNRKYARKKDAWAFGLLAASLLKGGVYFMPGHSRPLPCLSFIYDLLTYKRDGSLNDAKVCSLKQKEIDAMIQKELKHLNPAIQEDRTRIAWWTAIQHWLQVDPDKRCDLKECHLIEEC